MPILVHYMHPQIVIPHIFTVTSIQHGSLSFRDFIVRTKQYIVPNAKFKTPFRDLIIIEIQIGSRTVSKIRGYLAGCHYSR